MISKDLLNLLICPKCHSAVREQTTYLECTACHHQFPIQNGIPLLRVDPHETLQESSPQNLKTHKSQA